MARAFDITTPVTKVTVDASSKVEVTFAITNLLDREVKVRVVAVAENVKESDWLTPIEPVKSLNVRQTETFTVRAVVPPGTAIGDYAFKIIASNDANPEEESTEGPSVVVHVGVATKRKIPWLWIAIGAAVVALGPIIYLLIPDHAPAKRYELTVSRAGAGSGGISATPGGTTCGLPCTLTFAGGTRVTLRAVPEGTDTFAGWSLGPCTGTGDCQLTMDGPVALTASFAVRQPCDLTKPFGAPRQVPGDGINTEQLESSATLTSDELVLFFTSNRASNHGTDLYEAKRPSRDAPFSSPSRLGDLSTAEAEDRHPSVTGNGLELFYESNRGGRYSIYSVKRSNLSFPFSAPVLVPGINSNANDWNPSILPNASLIYYLTDRSGSGVEIYRAERSGSEFLAPSAVSVGGLPRFVQFPAISADDQNLYFDNRSDIWVAKRAAGSRSFGEATPVAELNTASHEAPDWVSPDGCRIYFTRGEADGNFDLWFASRP